MNGQFPSTLLEKAVNEFAKLPGVGRKTAMRLVLHLLRQDTAVVEAFGNAIVTLKHEVKYCKVCHNISDTETCRICSSPQRDASVVCVVENIRDVMAVEATQQFRGLYHVLGGVISPMDGIGPGDLQIESLVQRVGDSRLKQYDGGRYHQFLYLAQACRLSREALCHSPWHFHRRRIGVYG